MPAIVTWHLGGANHPTARDCERQWPGRTDLFRDRGSGGGWRCSQAFLSSRGSWPRPLPVAGCGQTNARLGTEHCPPP